MNNQVVRRFLVSLFTLVFVFPLVHTEYVSQIQALQLAIEPTDGIMAGQPVSSPDALEPSLLFYLSGQQNFEADYSASGQTLPNYLRDVQFINDGPFGPAIQADDYQLLSYWAPGNIYAQRGTLSFYWRSRYPVGPTEFPVFRVGYADHSSWDMVWLRIDYNGSGFDAFVTNVGLSRTRITHFMDEFPGPDEWIHIALSWDETEGIRFYVNGVLAGFQTTVGKVYDTGLDQFGPHSRIISPYQVQSRYNYMRGGDLAELRIYDRMLSDENIEELNRGEILSVIPDLNRDHAERKWRDAWWTRHGWNLPNEAPPALTSSHTSVKKVPVRDAIDIKRWYWKANDGIREKTWPGVYNMSRLPGRYDYFVLPDWDTYSMGGQTVRFHLPEDEPWNHVEMWGTAWGQLTHESVYPYDHTFAVRSRHQIKSYNRLDESKQGGVIRFDNALIEEPIGSFAVYNVEEGRAPQNRRSESFTLVVAPSTLTNSALQSVANFVQGRYPVDERAMMVGVSRQRSFGETADVLPVHTQPFIHIAIPYSDDSESGLDGVEIVIPALDVRPTHGELLPLNLRIKDPLWLMRDLADISFSVEPGRAYTLYIDTRDRMLPKGRALYLTIAGASSDLTPKHLEEATVRLIYKAKEDALAEHIKDRITQVRDLHAHNVEENPRTPRLNSYNRVMADLNDILKYDPHHWLARAYYYWITTEPDDRPEYEIAPVPEGVPEWAHLQIEYLRHLERIAMFFIDERQISNGEFGGGLSDDGDWTNFYPGMAFLGVNPDKILESLLLHMTSYYDQDRDSYDSALKQRSLPLFTNGLATIQTDELHAYEEGVQVVAQLNVLDYGTPLHFNRAMETSKRILEDITQINPDGHRLFHSRHYSGTEISTEDPWQWSVSSSYLMLHTSYLVALYNGNPELQQMIIDIADALLDKRDEDGNHITEIHFETGETRGGTGLHRSWSVFRAAFEFTGDEKYLEPIKNRIPVSRPFNPELLVDRYTEEIKELGVREYIHTDGSLWIDRIRSHYHAVAQEDRLGGVAMTRIEYIYPEHKISWKFKAPANFESVAIYLPEATKRKIDVIAYNLDKVSVNAKLTTWDILPGRWRVQYGSDITGDLQIDGQPIEQTIELQRGSEINLSFEPNRYSIIHLELIEPATSGYWERADLGMGREDIQISETEVKVRVHSMGAVGTPETTLQLWDASGNMVAEVPVPALEAPIDLVPRWTDIKISIDRDVNLTKGSVVIDAENNIPQITRRNTKVDW